MQLSILRLGAAQADLSIDATRRALASRVEELSAQVRTGQRDGFVQTWAAVALALDAHFGDETAALSMSARRTPALREAGQQLDERHAAARQLIDEIGEQLQRRQPRACTLEVLAELIWPRLAAENAATRQRNVA